MILATISVVSLTTLTYPQRLELCQWLDSVSDAIRLGKHDSETAPLIFELADKHDDAIGTPQ